MATRVREEMRKSTVNPFNIKFKYSSKCPSIHHSQPTMSRSEMDLDALQSSCFYVPFDLTLLLCFRTKAKRLHASTTSHA